MLKLYSKLKVRFLLNPAERAEYFKKTGFLKMGEGCEIYHDVSFGSEPYLVILGNKVRIAAGVRFVTHDGGMFVIRNLGMNPNADKVDKIVIGSNVFIGYNSIVMPGVTIGSNVVIGAGGVVTKDVPDNSVVAGVPAKVLCTIEEYYIKNKDKMDDTKQMSHSDKKAFYQNKFNINA